MQKSLAALLAFAIILLASSAQALPVQGNGAWIQKNNIDNPWMLSEKWDWYIVPVAMVDDVRGRTVKPIIMSLSGTATFDGFVRSLDAHHEQIVAVVWDYEPPGGATMERAERDLSAAQWYSRWAYSLPFGVATLAGDLNSYRKNGVAFERAGLFADFLMPEIYPPWWGNSPEKTLGAYWWAIALSPVEVLPILALSCPKAPISEPMSSKEMFSNYYGLFPKVSARAWWGLKDLDEERTWAVHFMK
jgi:hypothetical protein